MDMYELEKPNQSRLGRNIILGCMGVFAFVLLCASLLLNAYLGWTSLQEESSNEVLFSEEQGVNDETISPGELVLEFGSGDHYYIRTKEGLVVGGYANGSNTWKVVGGAFDGQNLQVTIVTSDRFDCKQWWSHNFVVNSTQVILRSSVDKCGNVISERNVSYERLGNP